MEDRSDDPSYHERTLLPRSYISLHVVIISSSSNSSSSSTIVIVVDIDVIVVCNSSMLISLFCCYFCLLVFTVLLAYWHDQMASVNQMSKDILYLT